MIFLNLRQEIFMKAVLQMEQIYFGQRIAALRKDRGMTQEVLAKKLGVTNQAVSKWESDQCCPDIMQLPALADIFEISLDALFGRAEPTPPQPEPVVAELPWEDNDDLHAVCFVGHRLVRYQDIPAPGGKRVRFSFSCLGFDKSLGWSNEPVQLHFSGNVGSIYSDFAVYCADTAVGGSVQAGDSVTCGDVGGDVRAGDGVTCANVQGDVHAGDSVNCAEVRGNVSAGDSVNCVSVGGNARAGDDVHCEGDIGGSVTASGDVTCTGSIGGNASAEGDLRCTQVSGSAIAQGDINLG